jgi:hypothetical protein
MKRGAANSALERDACGPALRACPRAAQRERYADGREISRAVKSAHGARI